MESPESKELKLLFIQEELSQHGEWLSDVLSDVIEQRNLKRTDNLHFSIDYRTFTSNGEPGVKFSFFSYGRAFEIAGNKKNRFTVNINKDVWGIRNRKDNMKKNTRWYAKNMYGGLNRLISRVMYGLSDQEIERLKGILQNRNNNSQ